MSSLAPKTYVMSLTAQEIEQRLMSIDSLLPNTVIRQSLSNPATDTVPSTQAVVDALAPIQTSINGLGGLADNDSVSLDSTETSGVLPISKGGTGGTSLEDAQSNLGVLSEDEIQALINASIPTIQQVWLDSAQVKGVLPVSKGGTGSNSPSEALKNLGIHDSNGKVPFTQLPAVAITDTFPVNNQSAMLALDAQAGDVAIRSDISKSFILMQEPANVLDNWKELLNDAEVKLTPQIRESLRRSYAEAGYNVVGTFQAGFTLVNANDVGVDETTGKGYTGPAGEIAAGTNPVGPGFFIVSKSSLRSQTFQRWVATGVIDVSKAGTTVPENAFKYDADGAQYVYKADTCYVLEDFGYGPSATPEWNSRVFNALIPKAKGMFIASRTINATVNHDAPVDIINRVTIMLPQSLKIRKTGSTVGSIVRTIKPAGGTTQNYTFSKDCIFNVIPEDNTINYAVYVNVIGGDLGGDSHSGKGVFDAPMAAYCTLSRIIGSESKFFWTGLDNFQNTFEDIRSRFSEKHFYIENGTSNNFSRVACDGGKDGTSVGTGFQLACKYTTMTACAADKVQLSYDIFDNGEVTMVGCGSESFGRLIRTRDNAVAVVKGGKLQYDVVTSNLGIAAEPWVSYDNSTLILEGTTLSAENFSGAADSVAFAPLSRPVAVGTSRFIAKNCKHPSLSSITPVFQGDEIIVQGQAYGEWEFGGKRKRLSATSLYIENTTSKQRMQKDIASVPGDGTWVTVGQFDLAAYGSSVMGEVTVTVYSSYTSGVGLAGFGKMLFSAVQQASGGALSVNNSTLQVARTDFSPAQPSPTIEMQVVASSTTATLQIKLTSGGGTLSTSSVSLDVEYISRKSGLPGRIDMF